MQTMRGSVHAGDGDSAINHVDEQAQAFIRPSEASEQKSRGPIILARGKYLRIVPTEINSLAIMNDAGAPFTFVEMNTLKSGRCRRRLLPPILHILHLQAWSKIATSVVQPIPILVVDDLRRQRIGQKTMHPDRFAVDPGMSIKCSMPFYGAPLMRQDEIEVLVIDQRKKAPREGHLFRRTDFRGMMVAATAKWMCPTSNFGSNSKKFWFVNSRGAA
ncbi:hypothetical protein [Bradyrhizobium sp. STM 3843]|uniref:hypothetical protein n=1 Tax=Bradyrhizobium sp. STM 3843 TaxID=551947 RepID=UPI00068087F8|nr:hypothetical protein [Bradyrhizobium sp. STM 3843]